MPSKNPPKEEAPKAIADELRRLGVKGILVKIAELGQLVELKCEMPECYHEFGRSNFTPREHPTGPWSPSADHYPILKSDGGKLQPGNVRLAHVRCNQIDSARRTQIRRLLDSGDSLAQIAETLNRNGNSPNHSSTQWTPAMVRQMFIS